MRIRGSFGSFRQRREQKPRVKEAIRIREGTVRPEWESEDDWEELLLPVAVPLWRRIFRAVWAPILFYLMFGALIFATGVYEVTDNILLIAVVSIPLVGALAALVAAVLWEFLLRPLLVTSGWRSPDD